MINPDLMVALAVVAYPFAIFRLTGLLVFDSGPLQMFRRWRLWFKINRHHNRHNKMGWWYATWKSFEAGANCQYCTGVWVGTVLLPLFVLALVWFPAWVVLIYLGAIGVQNHLERGHS